MENFKYCQYCGNKLNEGQDICLKCGKFVNSKNYNYENASTVTKAILGVISFICPVVGAILYYHFRKTDPSTAKICNLVSWISFLLFGIWFIFTPKIFFL